MIDANEVEIVRCGGLEPIVESAVQVADIIIHGSRAYEAKGTAVVVDHFEELGAQCARALRNLSVNGTPALRAPLVFCFLIPLCR